AKIDRNDTGADKKPEKEKVGTTKGVEGSLKEDGNQKSTRHACLKVAMSTLTRRGQRR
ncbi:hypothetical protein A2U01_0053742, partial [Trifolium medium]|nr:hypothetical protein [Trifolium medium]